MHLHAPETKTTLLVMCMSELSSWKFASLSWSNIWNIGFTWLPKMSTYLLAVIRPFRVITEQHNTKILLPKSSQIRFHVSSWNQAFRIIGFFGRSPTIDPALCWEQREGRLKWSYYLFRHPTSRFYYHHTIFSPFSVVFSNQSFINCSSTVDGGFVKLSS